MAESKIEETTEGNATIIKRKCNKIMTKFSYRSEIDVRTEYEHKLQNTLKSYNDKKLNLKIKRRVNKFIVIPGIPFPYSQMHQTSTKTYTNKLNIDLEIYLAHLRDSVMLLKMSKETFRVISKQKKGNSCPYPIFIPTSDNYAKFDQNIIYVRTQ